ncbi:MAG: heavy metal translocating P-type ATPase [Bryobacteraceae bacterium]|nr:heavy metal translocating P-type ATPase [Bryobacteraceae bacterium]
MSDCALCGLPVRVPPETGPAFCCPGCRNVYAILVESGVVATGANLRETELYRRSLELGLIAKPADERRPARIPEGAPLKEDLLQISGMWCASCAWLIEHALASEPGVASAEVFFASDLVRVRYAPQFLPPDRIVRRVESLGYRAAPYSAEARGASAEARDLMLRLGVAAFLWLNVMTLNVAIYVGYIQSLPGDFRRMLPFVLMALATPAIFYSAMPVLRLAWRGLLNRAVRMESLLALGILAAYFYSVVETFRGGEHIYFDTACAILTFVLFGKSIERAAKERTSRAVTLLYRMLPAKARLLVDGRERFVSIDALAPGQVFVVKAGERIPADGVVVEGESHVDESLLTGESHPLTRRPGSLVVGGSLSTSGVLHVRATGVGEASTLSQIVRTVERALANRSNIERAVDRVSRWFVPGVVVLALATFIGWQSAGLPAGEALMRAITVLVIACPCALGIATPLAITAAVGAASRNGILVGDSRILETIPKIDVAVLDKTGTVTEGNFALLSFDPADLPLVASLEASSEHPLARAVVNSARERGLSLLPASGVEIRKGEGITGAVDGRSVFIGNRRLAVDQSGAQASSACDQLAAGLESSLTVAFYGWNGAVRGALAFGDRIRPEAPELVANLKRRGIRVWLVTGDSPRAGAWAAQRIGAADFRAEVSPAGKAAFVADLRRTGSVVAMIGDGVNDAPALAEADLGIAMGSGADIAMEAAAMVLVDARLEKIPFAFDLARRTLAIVRQNLFWAFFYNTAGIALAVSGVLHPILAAAAMVVSSLTVVGNSLRLSRGQSPAADSHAASVSPSMPPRIADPVKPPEASTGRRPPIASGIPPVSAGPAAFSSDRAATGERPRSRSARQSADPGRAYPLARQ